MEKNNISITKDIENLLRVYFGQSEASAFYQKLKTPSDNAGVMKEVSNPDDERQLTSEISAGFKERDLITGIVTFAEKKLSKEKFPTFLLELAELMTFNGEVSLAAELSDDVISKSEGDPGLLKYKAQAHLSLARIAWLQAYWEQSREEVQKSYELFAEIEHKEGFAKCENMLATIYGEQGEIEKSLKHLERSLILRRQRQYGASSYV